jgi:WD40 repeat protein
MDHLLFSANTNSVDVLDFKTGKVRQSTPYSFKQVEIASSSLDSSPLCFATKSESNNLAVFALEDQQHIFSIDFPVALDIFTVSPSGTWLVGGVSTSVNVWEISSGNLVASIDLGSKVLALEFTQNEGILFSATDSGKVYGWNVYELFSESPTAAFIWDTGASTQIVKAGYNQGLVYTVSHGSIDGTVESSVKIWNLVADDVDSQLVYTYDVNSEITAIAIDSAERAVYAGTASGEVLPLERFVVNPTTGLVDYPMENGQVVSVDITKSQTLVHGTSASVTSITLANDGVVLVAGYADGTVASFKTFSKELDLTLKPADSHAVINLSIVNSTYNRDCKPNPIGAFPEEFSSQKRFSGAGGRLDHEVWIKLHDKSLQFSQQSETSSDTITDLEQRIRAGANFFSSPETLVGETGTKDEEAALRLKIQQLEQELSQTTQQQS